MEFLKARNIDELLTKMDKVSYRLAELITHEMGITKSDRLKSYLYYNDHEEKVFPDDIKNLFSDGNRLEIILEQEQLMEYKHDYETRGRRMQQILDLNRDLNHFHFRNEQEDKINTVGLLQVAAMNDLNQSLSEIQKSLSKLHDEIAYFRKDYNNSPY